MIGCPRRFPFSWSPATEKVDLRFFFLLQFLAIFASISGHVIDVRSTYPDQFRSVSYIYIDMAIQLVDYLALLVVICGQSLGQAECGP